VLQSAKCCTVNNKTDININLASICDKMVVTARQTHIRLTHKLYNYLTAELPQGETSHCDECQSQTYRNVSKSEISQVST